MENLNKNKMEKGSNMRLPKFEEYWKGFPNSRVEIAYKKVEEKLLNGQKVNIGDNIGYLRCFVKERQLDFYEHRNPKQLEEALQPILNYVSDDEYFYPHLEAESCIKDSYLAIEDYDTYWELTFKKPMENFSNKLKKILMFDDIYSVYKKCNSANIDGRIIIACVGVQEAKITKFGRGHVLELFQVMNSYVEDFIEKEGMDPFQYFYRKYVENPLTPELAEELKPYMNASRFEPVKKSYFYEMKCEEEDKQEYEKWKKTRVKKIKESDSPEVRYDKEHHNQIRAGIVHTYENRYKQKMGTDRNGNDIYVPFKRFHQFINEAFEGYCNLLLRTCENILRKKKNLPKIGEGWIGETILYYLIKERFVDEKVEMHGSPLWLGRQHLDIYFPERNIAVEYQGIQHDKPVAFFGGEEKFKEQKERDERKAKLCKKYNCHLIYVREGYDTKEVLKAVEAAIHS